MRFEEWTMPCVRTRSSVRGVSSQAGARYPRGLTPSTLSSAFIPCSKAALLVGLGRIRPVVPVAVVTDLVPGVADGARLVCVVLDHPAGDIKGRPNAFGAEEAEQARDADLRAVAALRHDSGRVGGLRVAREPQRLGVEIEGEHDGAARPLRPRRRRHTLRQGSLPMPSSPARKAGGAG